MNLNNKNVPEINFTEREISVLWCVIQGMNNKNIAKNLYISVSTVKFYLESIYSKTKTQNRTELTNKIFCLMLDSPIDYFSFSKFFSHSAGRHKT